MSSSVKYVQQLCMLVAGLTNIMAYISSEPDYKHMLYGGVWKHVIFNPPEHMPDIIHASKHLILFIRNWYPDAVTDNMILTCLSKIDLCYSDSDQTPIAITEYVTSRNGDQFPISVPVTFGSTYNFQLTFSQKDSTKIIHHITVTKTLEMEQFYVYSHTFHTTIKEFQEKHLSGCSKDFSKKLPILSNLSVNKMLELTPEQKCVSEENFCQLHQSQVASVLPYDDELHTDVPQTNSEQVVMQNENIKQINSTRLNIMTYNIWNFNTYQQNGGYFQRINRISKLLKKASPDIVAFQEVRLETPLGGKLGPCQMNHLISLLPQYQFVYQPAQMQTNSIEQGRTEEGLAIFSKYPIIHHDYLLLFRNQSNSADLNQRICLHAVILVPSFGKVHVFNTHFSLSHEAREAAVTQILEYMNSYDGALVTLMGDLNAGPTEISVRMLSKSSGLLDTWDHLHPSSDGFTFSCVEDELSKRIDYIFMKKTDNVSVQKVEVLGDRTRSDAASDHRAVVATFALNEKDAA